VFINVLGDVAGCGLMNFLGLSIMILNANMIVKAKYLNIRAKSLYTNKFHLYLIS